MPPMNDAGFNRDLGALLPPARPSRNVFDNGASAMNFGFNNPWQAFGNSMWAQASPQTQLYQQAFGGGNSYAPTDPWAMLSNGVGTMNGLGGQIGATFALANQQSGQNLANNYAANAAINQGLGAANVAAQAQMYESQQRNQRIKDALPLFAAIIGRLGGGSGGGSTGFSTNYGAGGHI